MKNNNKKYMISCQTIKQLSVLKQLAFVSLTLVISTVTFAQELSLEALNPYSKIRTRLPSNFVPSDDVQPAPFFENKLWVDKVFVQDNEGVLAGMKGNIQSWQDTEEYAKYWNLESTGLYNTPEEVARKKMFEKTMLKYADKRLTGEMKDAEEGSPMASVNKAQRALRPQGEVGVSQNVKFKFKARALQGEGKVIVENPWIDYETRYKVFNNGLYTSASKNFKTIGFRTGADIAVKDKNWTAFFDQKITQEVSARVTSSQASNQMMFDSGSDSVFQLMYSKGW